MCCSVKNRKGSAGCFCFFRMSYLNCASEFARAVIREYPNDRANSDENGMPLKTLNNNNNRHYNNNNHNNHNNKTYHRMWMFWGHRLCHWASVPYAGTFSSMYVRILCVILENWKCWQSAFSIYFSLPHAQKAENQKKMSFKKTKQKKYIYSCWY